MIVASSLPDSKEMDWPLHSCGLMYGRGTLDMKQMVAMEAMTMLLLKRTGVPLKRDVIYMAAADEECGGHAGAGWVVAHRPELIQAEYALNEGGGSGFEINGRRYYPVQTAEKGTVRFRLRTHGRPGHGSVPYDENTILTLAAFLAKLTPDLLPVHGTAHRTLTWSAAFAARSTQYRRVSGRKNWNASPLRYGRSVAHAAW